MDLKIFVDVDSDTRLARRIRRDIVQRGRDVIQVLDQYERSVKPSHDVFIYPTRSEADIIIPRGAENPGRHRRCAAGAEGQAVCQSEGCELTAC